MIIVIRSAIVEMCEINELTLPWTSVGDWGNLQQRIRFHKNVCSIRIDSV